MFLIIGYGNTLRSDDGVGQWMAQRLQAICDPAVVQVIACHQLTPELVEPISRVDDVIFVDVSEDGLPGEIHRCSVTPDSTPQSFTHQASPSGLLAASQALYNRCPVAELVSVGGACFDYGEQLSPVVSDALPHLINAILKRVNEKTVHHA